MICFICFSVYADIILQDCKIVCFARCNLYAGKFASVCIYVCTFAWEDRKFVLIRNNISTFNVDYYKNDKIVLLSVEGTGGHYLHGTDTEDQRGPGIDR